MALLHDMCTFASKDTCLGYSVGYITKSWRYHLLALGIVPHNEGHSAQQVSHSLQTEFQFNFKVDLGCILESVRSDTAAAALCVAKKFDLEPDLCAMHSGDLAMSYACGIKYKANDPFDSGVELIKKHSAIAAHFSRSTKDLHSLQQIASAMNLPCLTPQVRNSTRIGSTCNMLLTNLINREALMFFFLQNRDLGERLELSSEEWQSTAEMEGILQRCVD